MTSRRRIFLTLICLLTLATSAHAECAWLLWRQEEATASISPQPRWTTPLAYPDRGACVAVIAANVTAWEQGRSPDQEVRPAGNGTAAEFITWGPGRRGFLAQRLHCLPDTVDPRGPKGAGR
jgi:hypothetical protein